MRIGVISPSRNAGCTTISCILADVMSRTFSRNVILTHTDPQSFAMDKYMNLRREYDPTRSITQVVRLLEVNAINSEQILDYATAATPRLFTLGNSEDNIAEDDYNKLTNFLLTNIDDSTDTVIDITTEINDPCTQELIKNIDFFVIVLTQDEIALNRFNRWLESEYTDGLRDKVSMYVVNNYNPVISPLREISKSLRIRHQKFCKLSYNPFIPKMGNNGTLSEIVDYALDRDYRLLDIYSDLHECMQVIAANQGIHLNWR